MIDTKTDKRVGERIRATRRSQGLTLQQVAAQSGLSVGFLSQIERNLTGITLSSLVNVAKALQVPLRDLVSQPEQTALVSHQGQRKIYSIEDSSPRYERLSTVFPGSCMHAVKILVPVGYRSEFVAHAGEELLYMLSGRLEYTVRQQMYLLEAGDSLHFDGSHLHRFSNIGDGIAEVLWAGTLPLFEEALLPGAPEQGETESLFGPKHTS
jgi:transcriptional regulator with XRE-family HTH domain